MEKSARAKLIFQRTYCREKSPGEFETFQEVVNRVVDHQKWLYCRALGREDAFWNGEKIKEVEYHCFKLRDIMLSMRAMPSGRTLWLGGTDTSKKREISSFNPGRRSTKFITDQGVRSFEDFEDGDEVVALTHEGNWKQARVMRAGVQPVNEITFTYGNNKQVEYFTPTHTWILKDGSRTQNLKVGDRIYAPPSPFYEWEFENAEVDEKLWWAYGFVYGDGSVVTKDIYKQSLVRLCGDKAKYLNRFIELGFKHSFPPSCNNDPYVYTGKYLKTLPKSSDEIRLIRAFVRGYLDADGNINFNRKSDENNLHYLIQATNPEAQQFIETFFPVVGLYIQSKREASEKTNYGYRSNKTYIYKIKSRFHGVCHLGNYHVKSIEPQGEEEVWCLTVEDDHSFVLPNGIVTGNCAFLPIATINDVVDMFWLLLNTCGVGFEPQRGTLNGFAKEHNIRFIRSENRNVKGKEENVETVDNDTWTIVVGDSSQAWAKVVGKLLAGKHRVENLVIDFRQIRAPGYRLSGYGYISAGDELLYNGLKGICAVLNRCADKLLSKIDIMDICNHLGSILSTRRAAEICQMPFDDAEFEDFALAKRNHVSENPQRSQSNNSIVFYRRPTKRELKQNFKLMVDSGGSEPGIINLEAAQHKRAYTQGLNPCLPGFATVLTPNGIRQLDDVKVGDLIWSNESWTKIVDKWSTGIKSVFKYITTGGSFISTSNHRIVSNGVKVEVGSAESLDLSIPYFEFPDEFDLESVIDGLVMGDGCVSYSSGHVESKRIYLQMGQNDQDYLTDEISSLIIGTRYPSEPNKLLVKTSFTKDELNYTYNRDIPDRYLYADANIVASFLRGLFSANGSVVDNRVTLRATSRLVIDKAQLMLNALGIKSFITTTKPSTIEWHNGTFTSKQSYTLNVCDTIRYAALIGFVQKYKVEKLNNIKLRRSKKENYDIVDVEYLGEYEVYDITVDNESHTFWCNGVNTSNCGESLLSRYSLCNLVEVNLPAIPTFSELKYTLENMARVNYLQTCVNLRDGVLQDAWHETNEFLRLCGVGITGIGLWDHTIVDPSPEKAFQIIRGIVQNAIKEFSEHLNMPNSKATTLVKPSGTLSKCMDTWEGLHRPIGKYIFNRINFSEHDPNLVELERCGYEITVNPMDTTSRLVNFPVKWDSNVFTEKDGVYLNTETAIDQLNRYKLIANNYCDHNASITVFYQPDEIPDIIDWVYHNWDDYIGVTFFPRQDPTMTAADLGYAYLPQQVVTAADYHAYADKLKPVSNFAGFLNAELDDECKGGSCPVR